VGQERIGVLLLNLGGPDSLDDVQPFLYNLFADPDIIRLPQPVQFLQPAIAQLVSTLRAPKSREGYESIGGGSPLRRITEEQAGALRDALRDKGINAQTYVAMRYWYPFTGGSGLRVAGGGRKGDPDGGGAFRLKWWRGSGTVGGRASVEAAKVTPPLPPLVRKAPARRWPAALPGPSLSAGSLPACLPAPQRRPSPR
jgi:hypothetical protein